MHVLFTYHMSLVDSSMEPAALLIACKNPPLLPLSYALGQDAS
jgi:hypothetical protein